MLQKTEKKERKRKKERLKVGNNNGHTFSIFSSLDLMLHPKTLNPRLYFNFSNIRRQRQKENKIPIDNDSW